MTSRLHWGLLYRHLAGLGGGKVSNVLSLNLLKCEIITQDHTTFETILTSIPGNQRVEPTYATLLGSPLGDGSCISRAIAEKIDALKRVGEKFEVLSAHDALC